MFLEGQHINLREVYKSDLPIFQEFRNVYQDTKNYRTIMPITEKKQEWYWDNVVNNPEKHVVFTIIVKQSIQIVGEIRASNIDWIRGNFEVGILIGKKFRDKGYGREALNMLLDYTFSRLRMHKAIAIISIDNTKSIKLFESCRFIQEGTLRETNYYDGKYHDTLIFGLLDNEHNGSFDIR